MKFYGGLMSDFPEKCHILMSFLSRKMLILSEQNEQNMQLIGLKTVAFEVCEHDLIRNNSKRLIEPYFASTEGNL